MKKEIHPEIHLIDVHCACGHTFKTQSTQKDLRVEICSKCHPFFTGKQKIIDSAGRVERFQRKYAAVEKKNAKEKVGAKPEAKTETKPEAKTETKAGTETEAKTETKAENKPETKDEKKSEIKEKEGSETPPAEKE